MKKSLLICIAFHYNPDRLKWLKEVLDNFYNNYKVSFDIIVDVNVRVVPELTPYKNLVTSSHPDLEHPFYLTWCHREHIKELIDQYDNFMYVEDDTLIPYENYLNYLENFKTLFPWYIPSFIQIEQSLEDKYVVAVTKPQEKHLITIKDKTFVLLTPPYNYHGCWIIPAKELKDTLLDTFVRFDQSRETAAAYTAWELNKQTFLEFENGEISEKCYVYHLPNNYIASNTLHSKIKPKNIFI